MINVDDGTVHFEIDQRCVCVCVRMCALMATQNKILSDSVDDRCAMCFDFQREYQSERSSYIHSIHTNICR